MFLKVARSMISIPCNASKRHNFYGLQNATTTHEMLQILANMKSTNDETLNILVVLYAFLHSLKRTIWIASRTLREVRFSWIMAVAQTSSK